MSSSSLSSRLRKNLHLKRYLEELGSLTGRLVRADELGSLEQATEMRRTALLQINSLPSVSFDVRFSDRSTERFKCFLKNLMDANPSPVYVWTPDTIDCGTLLVPSLGAIKFDFDFSINDDGILSFLASDLKDRLLLDFSVTSTGEQVMKIETQGPDWAKVIY